MIKLLRNFSRLLVGAVFIFSGFVKGIDPLGSTYKFMDYFDAFGMGFLDGIALPLAIILSTAEFIIGIALFLKIRMKEISWAVLVFMIFFTGLTLYIAITNPVTDCGCFGDALIMTNWQTFFKNVVLILLVIFIFKQRNKFVNGLKPVTEWTVFGLFIVFSVGLSLYCYNNLPLLDFRPYRVGTHIPDKMKIPEGAPQPEYKTILKYQKNGEVKEFDINNLPDSTWTWVETENILVEEGYVPPIHDFTMDPLDGGGNIADRVLEDEGYSFLLIAYNLEDYRYENQDKINELASFSNNNGHRFIGLTSSSAQEIEQYREETGGFFDFYHTDEITLKTIVRSNPGLVLLRGGTILGKWHHTDIPTVDEMDNKFLSYVLTHSKNARGKLIILSFLMAFFLLIALFQLVRKRL